MTQIGQFPKRKRPDAICSEIDIKGRFLSYDRLNDEISNYKLSLFNPSHYVKPEFKSIYEREKIQTFNQQRREELLIGMMKVNFLKRLESSVHSFGITMERTVNKIEDLEGRLRRFLEHQTQLGRRDRRGRGIACRFQGSFELTSDRAAFGGYGTQPSDRDNQ